MARGNGQRGQGILEYTLIIMLIAMVVLLVMVAFGTQIGNAFSTITAGL